MILSDSQWRTITELIREAERVARRTTAYGENLQPELLRCAEAAYLVQVEAETAERRMVDRGGESGGMAPSAGSSGAMPDTPPTTSDRRATERHAGSPIDPSDITPDTTSRPEET